MSVLTTFRTHPLVHASYLGAALPALILGASGTLPGTALIVYGCLVTLPHANLRWTFGPLGRVFVSPAYHRLHHSTVPLLPAGAVNMGFVLVCWDQLARRAVFPTGGRPDRHRDRRTTSTCRAVGRRTRSGGRPNVAGVMAAQLTQPFRLRAATDGQS